MAELIDASELRSYGRNLAANTLKARALVSAAVSKGALNIKNAIQEDVRGSSNPGIRRISITYVMDTGTDGITADIMPRDDKPSKLANIAFFGTARGGGSHRFYEHADDELPMLTKFVAEAGVEALK